MSSPYGPPGGYPQWGQQPPGPGRQPGGAPGYPPPGGFSPQAPPPPQPYQPAPPYQPQPYTPPQHYGYGQPQPFYPSPGGFGSYAPEPPREKRSPLPWVLGGVGLLLVIGVVCVLGFVTPGWFVRPIFDASSVQKGVQQTLTDSYGIKGVSAVTCPSDQPVEAGASFQCRLRVDGQPKVVTVTVKNAEGVYEVGHPS